MESRDGESARKEEDDPNHHSTSERATFPDLSDQSSHATKPSPPPFVRPASSPAPAPLTQKLNLELLLWRCVADVRPRATLQRSDAVQPWRAALTCAPCRPSAEDTSEMGRELSRETMCPHGGARRTHYLPSHCDLRSIDATTPSLCRVSTTWCLRRMQVRVRRTMLTLRREGSRVGVRRRRPRRQGLHLAQRRQRTTARNLQTEG